MRRVFILLSLVFITACNDGDVLTIDLEFDGELERCENNTESYLIYDTREDPNESLSLIIPRTADNEMLFTEPTPVGEPVELMINGSSVRFGLRSYNRGLDTGELCELIPPANLTIVEDYEASTGSIFITTTIEDDDRDGVPTAFEGRGELDENGEYSNAQDTDGDGIPDYLDIDDDGDNVLTRTEIDDSDGDDDPTTNPLDTDNDGIPDYLDDDDDGDGVLTRLEDADGEGGPIDDTSDSIDGQIPLFRNPLEVITYTFEDYNAFENEYTRFVTTRFFITDIDLEILRTTEVDFGIFEDDFPIFPDQEDDDGDD